MFAPRRNAPCWMASVAFEKTWMKDRGPSVVPPELRTRSPCRTQAREPEARAAAGLLDQRRGLDRVKDAFDRVLDRQHEAGREHPHLAAGVHQRRAVGHELATRHQVVELARDGERLLGAAAGEGELGLRHAGGDAPVQLARRLVDLAVRQVLLEVALRENLLGVLRELGIVEVARRVELLERAQGLFAGRGSRGGLLGSGGHGIHGGDLRESEFKGLRPAQRATHATP